MKKKSLGTLETAPPPLLSLGVKRKSSSALLTGNQNVERRYPDRIDKEHEQEQEPDNFPEQHQQPVVQGIKRSDSGMKKLVRRVSQTLNASVSSSAPTNSVSSASHLTQSSCVFEWCPTVIDCTGEEGRTKEERENPEAVAIISEEEAAIGIGLQPKHTEDDTSSPPRRRGDPESPEDEESHGSRGQVKLLYAYDHSKQISFLDFKIGEFVAYGEGIVCTSSLHFSNSCPGILRA